MTPALFCVFWGWRRGRHTPDDTYERLRSASNRTSSVSPQVRRGSATTSARIKSHWHRYQEHEQQKDKKAHSTHHFIKEGEFFEPRRKSKVHEHFSQHCVFPRVSLHEDAYYSSHLPFKCIRVECLVGERWNTIRHCCSALLNYIRIHRA